MFAEQVSYIQKCGSYKKKSMYIFRLFIGPESIYCTMYFDQEKLNYSCSKIATTQIQISRQNWSGFSQILAIMSDDDFANSYTF